MGDPETAKENVNASCNSERVSKESASCSNVNEKITRGSRSCNIDECSQEAEVSRLSNTTNIMAVKIISSIMLSSVTHMTTVKTCVKC